MLKTRINQEGVYFSNVLWCKFVRTVDGVSTDCGPFDDELWCGFWHYLMVIINDCGFETRANLNRKFLSFLNFHFVFRSLNRTFGSAEGNFSRKNANKFAFSLA